LINQTGANETVLFSFYSTWLKS